MKTFITLLSFAAISSGIYASQPSEMQSIADRLAQMDQFGASAKFEVLLPTSEFPVVYNITLSSSPLKGDSLAPASYLINWSLEKDGNRSEGFSAYFPGNHYRYRDERLQEYHTEMDGIPFAPGGDISRGVQNQAQFCDLLPQYLSQTFETMQSDTTYKYTVHRDSVISREHVTAIEGVRSFQGVDALEFLYILDCETLRPLRSEFVSNPGQIGEQLITATYDYNDNPAIAPAPSSEEDLIKRYPEVFEKYRESTFRLENMPGRRLPPFTAPTTTGERYTLAKGGGFAVPTIVAVLDSSVGSTTETVRRLREAVDGLPMQTDLILAFVNNNTDMIEETTGRIRPGEHLLMSARGLARDCGISDTPVIMICDRDTTVKDLMIGFNNDITDFVIQTVAMIAR